MVIVYLGAAPDSDSDDCEVAAPPLWLVRGGRSLYGRVDTEWVQRLRARRQAVALAHQRARACRCVGPDKPEPEPEPEPFEAESFYS